MITQREAEGFNLQFSVPGIHESRRFAKWRPGKADESTAEAALPPIFVGWAGYSIASMVAPCWTFYCLNATDWPLTLKESARMCPLCLLDWCCIFKKQCYHFYPFASCCIHFYPFRSFLFFSGQKSRAAATFFLPSGSDRFLSESASTGTKVT